MSTQRKAQDAGSKPSPMTLAIGASAVSVAALATAFVALAHRHPGIALSLFWGAVISVTGSFAGSVAGIRRVVGRTAPAMVSAPILAPISLDRQTLKRAEV